MSQLMRRCNSQYECQRVEGCIGASVNVSGDGSMNGGITG